MASPDEDIVNLGLSLSPAVCLRLTLLPGVQRHQVIGLQILHEFSLVQNLAGIEWKRLIATMTSKCRACCVIVSGRDEVVPDGDALHAL